MAEAGMTADDLSAALEGGDVEDTGQALDLGDEVNEAQDSAGSAEVEGAAEQAAEAEDGTDAVAAGADEAQDPQDGDAEAGAEVADAGEPEDSPVVPHARFHQVLKRAQAAEQQLAEARAKEQQAQASQQPPEPVNYDAQIAELEQKFADALNDGDAAAAAEANKQMRVIEREQLRAEVTDGANRAAYEARETQAINNILDEIEPAIPAINPDHKDYDSDVADQVSALWSVYEDRGLPASQALAKAIETRFPGQLQAGKRNGTPGLKAKIAAANRQAPDASSFGEDGDAHGRTSSLPAVETLSVDDWGKLSEAEQAKLLGDDG